MFYDLVQHITDAHAVCSRNRNRFSNPEVIKLVYVHHIFLHAVHFVYYKDNRFSASSEHVCHFGIGIYKPLVHVRDKHDHICRINGNLRLLSHLGKNNIAAVRLNSSCIN